MTTIPATWTAEDGDWFDAGNWSEPNPSPPPPTLSYVPGADNDVNLPDNSGQGTPFTVTYDGTDTVNTLNGTASATLAINGGSLTVLDGGGNIGLDLASGATLSDSAGNLVLTSGDFSGTVAGAGTLTFVFGSFSIEAGVNLTIANWTLSSSTNGTVSITELNTNLTYAGNFTAIDVSGNSPVINLNGHTLTLSGTASLDGIFNGSGTVKITGAASEPSPEYGSNGMVGGAVLEIAAGGTFSQQQNLNLGDSSTGGTLQIDAGGHYTITGAPTTLGGSPNAVVSTTAR